MTKMLILAALATLPLASVQADQVDVTPTSEARPATTQPELSETYRNALNVWAETYCSFNAARLNTDYQTCYTILSMKLRTEVRAIGENRAFVF